MALLLPICVFDGKMQLLCNTYLKTLRKEKALLAINLIACVCSFVLCVIGAFFIVQPIAIVIAMVVSVTIRSCVAEYYLANEMKMKKDYGLVYEILLTIVFSFSSWFLKPFVAFSVYFVAFMVFLYINKHNVKSIITQLKNYMR